jgi:ketosteroid isomerase-like protein
MFSRVLTLSLLSLALTTSALAGDPVSRAERERLLTIRRSIWDSWFANDQARLKEMLPAETIAINNGEAAWQNRAQVIAAAQGFQANGGKLISLRFPKTEIQRYGDVVVFYSLFEMTTETGGKQSTTRGRATEIFVRKNGRWLNSGWHLDSGK